MGNRKRSSCQETEHWEESNRNNTCHGGRYGASVAALTLVAALLIFQTVTFISSKYSKEEPASEEKLSSYKKRISGSRASINTQKKPESSNRNELAKKTAAAPFPFNPNTISFDSLQLLGFTPRQAQTLINWRSKGGIFRKKEDFARIYSVSPEKYEQLKEFITIPQKRAISSARPSATSAHRPSYFTHPADSDSTYRPGWQQKPYAGRRDTIDLNFADSSDLTSLRGIGGYYARQIIAYRQRLGYFYSPEQLLEIPGIDSARFAQLRSRITVSLPLAGERGSVTSQTAQDSLQNTGFLLDLSDFRQPLCEMEPKQMASHPYIGAYLARSFIFIKKKYGAAALTLENLLHQGVISLELAKKLSHYFR